MKQKSARKIPITREEVEALISDLHDQLDAADGAQQQNLDFVMSPASMPGVELFSDEEAECYSRAFYGLEMLKEVIEHAQLTSEAGRLEQGEMLRLIAETLDEFRERYLLSLAARREQTLLRKFSR